MAVHYMLPALVFPRVYRKFLQQECDVASKVDTPHTKRLVERVGWSAGYYRDAVECDDEAIDGPWGPQQLLLHATLPIMQAFPEREQEVRVRVLLTIIDRLGVPNEQLERAAKVAMLADAERWISSPIENPKWACNHAVRAFASLTAAELGVVIPWNDESVTRLGLISPNSSPTGFSVDGQLVGLGRAAHDVTDMAGFAGDMLEFMSWLPLFGATHVPELEMLDRGWRGYLVERVHLHDRAAGVISSLLAIQLCWTEAHIAKLEAALKGRRRPWLLHARRMHVEFLIQEMQGVKGRSPIFGGAPPQVQAQLRAQIAQRVKEHGQPRVEAVRDVLADHLSRFALLTEDWESELNEKVPEQAALIAAGVRARIDAVEGVTAEPEIVGAVDAEGLGSIGRLKPPRWRGLVAEETRRLYDDAEASFISRVNWQPTPRIPDPPKHWSSILRGYATAVEAELLFGYFNPALAALARDSERFPSETLKRIRDERIDGKASIGTHFARFVLAARANGSSDGARSPCLGDMHFLLTVSSSRHSSDPGMPLIGHIQSALPRELRVRRNAEILGGINEYRTDSAHPRQADSDREITRERALLGRRIMLHYLSLLVGLRHASK
jgi:hypothetical protein